MPEPTTNLNAIKAIAGRLSFSGQSRWLEQHAIDEACRLFDGFGWMNGWVEMSHVAEQLWPDVVYSQRMSYLRALARYLEADGQMHGSPQLVVRRGVIAFEPDLIRRCVS